MSRTRRHALQVAWRGLAAFAFLCSCGAALALGPAEEGQPLGFFWFAGLGGMSAFGGWLAWNSIASSSRLRDQLHLIDTAFRCVDVAVVGLDDRGNIFFVNAAAARLADADQAQLTGRAFAEAFPLRSAADGTPVLLDQLRAACGEEAAAVRAVLRDAADNEHVLDISCACEENGRSQVSFLAMADVSVPHGISLELFWQANHEHPALMKSLFALDRRRAAPPRAHHRRAGAHGRRRIRRAAACLPGGAGAAHRQRHPHGCRQLPLRLAREGLPRRRQHRPGGAVRPDGERRGRDGAGGCRLLHGKGSRPRPDPRPPRQGRQPAAARRHEHRRDHPRRHRAQRLSPVPPAHRRA